MESSWKQKMFFLVFTIALVGLPLSGVFAQDNIAVTAFSVSPNSGVVAGNQVTVQMTITNLCKICGTLNIPWELTVDGIAISGGTVGVAAGASTTVNKGWTAVGGSHTFSGSIDKGNTLKDGTTSNNVPVPFSMSVCKIVTRLLDKVQTVPFVSTLVQGLTGCISVGVFGVSATEFTFRAFCPTASPMGVVATSDAFRGFKLKNGWKVKSYNNLEDKRQGGGWKFISPPKIGTDDPSTKVELSVTSLNADVIARFSITIEGPECTSPY